MPATSLSTPDHPLLTAHNIRKFESSLEPDFRVKQSSAAERGCFVQSAISNYANNRVLNIMLPSNSTLPSKMKTVKSQIGISKQLHSYLSTIHNTKMDKCTWCTSILCDTGIFSDSTPSSSEIHGWPLEKVQHYHLGIVLLHQQEFNAN